MHVLRNGTVVDADGVREADVAIEDGEIVAVGDVGRGDTETDLSGQFVAPGLVDSHVHLMMDGRPDVATAQQESSYDRSYIAAGNLRAAVEAGVTTVRDLGAPGSLAIDAGRAVAEDRLIGPRVLAAGQNVVMTGGHGHWFGREADGPDEVRKAAREQLKRGADVVKCMATGGVLTEGARTGAPELTPEELAALVDAAGAKGVPTAAHAHGKEGLLNAVDAGITSIEHGTFMDREAAAAMADAGTYWVPTASALENIVDNPDAGIPESAMTKALEAADAFASSFDHAAEEGVRVAMGTDAGTPFNHFEDIPDELAYMVDYGMTPAEALEAATVTGAQLCGLDDVGLVAEGYRADLVVLDDNPAEDADAWGDPVAVFADGEHVV
ncbi:amidohydrolase family protein [Halobaculum sp. CBA1158]|uniref:metal-dependent hydrolase family protein n=1 Tax=Halobaculum sp. CBA1158 TaxID=2904243 RepID=UPI001F39C571|nr:amidohydrolase family protein [Halobaculum sp. CBA1158]UIO98700.1 amidohydrolase family protein [Halobaculum sp. CBA1158]